MATVNLANNTWLTTRGTSTIKITANSSCVDFNMGDDLTDEMDCAKACIEINASDYKTITLQYNSLYSDGITSLYFGVFDSMAAYLQWFGDYCEISSDSLSGIGVTQIKSNSKKTITIDIPSDATGTKYVGFLFSGNTFWFDDDVGWSARQKINITSIDAVENSYTITYHANGGSGTTDSQTVDAGNEITLSANTFTAPTSPIWNLTLDGNGGNDGSPTFKGNYFHKWREESTSGTAYSAGSSYTPSGNTTMYAWWGTKYIWGTTTRDNDDPIEGYTVSFDANGGICDISSLTSTITTSYDFLGWGNSASNPTITFESDAEWHQTSDYTAYAIWSAPITTNGSITLPTPTRNGYKFIGWSLDAYDSTGITGEYAPEEDIMLYAIWEPMGLVYINDGEFSQYQIWIYDDSGWSQYIPYIYTESGWELYSG